MLALFRSIDALEAPVTDTLTACQVNQLLDTVQRVRRADGGLPTNAQVAIASATLRAADFHRHECRYCDTVDYFAYAEDVADFAADHAECATLAQLAAKTFTTGDCVTWDHAFVMHFGEVVSAGDDACTVRSILDHCIHTVSRADLTSCVVEAAR